jgi:general secretion pathway protein J
MSANARALKPTPSRGGFGWGWCTPHRAVPLRDCTCRPDSRFPILDSRLHSGFTLIELLVALVVFAALATAAYGGLNQIARTRSALAAQQDRFAAVTRAVSALERDLRQAVDRSVIDNNGGKPGALVGSPGSIELSRLGFANPLAEPRSNIERVVYALDNGKLRRGRYAVLDRAPNSAPATRTLVDRVGEFHLRYFGRDGAWRDAWPPQGAVPGSPNDLPRAVEFRFVLADFGEIRRVVELPSSLPPSAR